MKALQVAGLLIALLLSGCASRGGMVKATDMSPVRSDQARIVFMRSSLFGSAIAASVFDVTGESSKIIGVINKGSKVAYDLPPGQHTFMVVSEAADFMEATVLPGKTYYALVTPRMGAWKARFSFKPLRQADFATDEFARWNTDTSWVELGDKTRLWAERNAANIEVKRAKYWPEWSSKDLHQRESQTLNPDDGR